MKRYFCLITGIAALGTEVLVFLSLMEMPPFGKGGSDIIWALPFFGLIVFALGISGLISAIRVTKDTKQGIRLAIAGLLMNSLSLAVPILVLMFGAGRLFISAVGLTNH